MAVSAERRQCRVSMSDVWRSSPLSKVRRRCSIKTAVGQNAQPECNSFRNSQPMDPSILKEFGVFRVVPICGLAAFPIRYIWVDLSGRRSKHVGSHWWPRPRRSICRLASNDRWTGRLGRLTGPTKLWQGPGHF